VALGVAQVDIDAVEGERFEGVHRVGVADRGVTDFVHGGEGGGVAGGGGAVGGLKRSWNTAHRTCEVDWQFLPIYGGEYYIAFMATKQITRNIALTPHFDRLVRKKIASGRYQSASEVVREALRLLEQRDEVREQSVAKLQQDIELGWQQSERGAVVDGRAVFDEIREMSKTRRAKAKKR